MLCCSTQKANAQLIILDIIKAAVKKVIQAIDLKVQQLQNKTIWLQNAEKELENEMSKLKLNDITDWANKQKKLYADYYDELKKVKTAISTFQQVKNITQKQARILGEYNTAYNSFKNDRNFTPEELAYMGKVYNGILEESARNIQSLTLAITNYSTQMNDAKRLEMIRAASRKTDENLTSLRQFNAQNNMLSIQRSHDYNGNNTVQKLYGLPTN